MSRDPLHTYLAFYNKRQLEISASSLYDAKQKAVLAFNVGERNRHLVAVRLAELSRADQVT